MTKVKKNQLEVDDESSASSKLGSNPISQLTRSRPISNSSSNAKGTDRTAGRDGKRNRTPTTTGKTYGATNEEDSRSQQSQSVEGSASDYDSASASEIDSKDK